MNKKNYKIFTCISPDREIRNRMIQELLIRLGFACIKSDARKIIRESVYDIDLSTAYYVAVDTFAFRDSLLTTQRLYELAARGIAVVVGVKKLPREFELLAEAYYPEHLLQS